MTRIFISHASEDKDDIARPLAESLVQSGFSVWFDEFSLQIGDSLKTSIDEGLAMADYGVVILSPAFFSKRWTREELDGVTAIEISRKKKALLPIWHNLDFDDVVGYSPSLAGKFAIKSSAGMDSIMNSITQAINEREAFKTTDNLDEATIHVPNPRWKNNASPNEIEKRMLSRKLGNQGFSASPACVSY
jgi:hypothetical protein